MSDIPRRSGGTSSFPITNVSDSFAFLFAFFFCTDFAMMILQAECAGHAIPEGPGRQGFVFFGGGCPSFMIRIGFRVGFCGGGT